MCFEQSKYYKTTGKISTETGIDNPMSCQKKCRNTEGCEYWSLRTDMGNNCHLLKIGNDDTSYCSSDACFRGPKNCQSGNILYELFGSLNEFRKPRTRSSQWL